MAEEKPEGTPPEGTPPEGTPPEGTPPEGTPPETKPDEVNWEQRYKDLQAESTKTSQEAAELRTQVEQLEQPPKEPPEEDLELDEDGFVDGKTVNEIVNRRVNAAVEKAVRLIRSQSADAYFRRTYKELVKHTGIIAGIMRNPKNPEKVKGASPEERIDAAVEEFNALTEEAKAKAKTEAEAEAKAKEEAKAKASGLGSTTTSTPAKGDEDISDEQEIANRKAHQANQRGLG